MITPVNKLHTYFFVIEGFREKVLVNCGESLLLEWDVCCCSGRRGIILRHLRCGCSIINRCYKVLAMSQFVPINRRQLLVKTSMVLGTLAVQHAVLVDAQGQERGAEQGKSDSVSKIALLSDTHISSDSEDSFRNFTPSQNFSLALQEVKKGDWGLGIVCGDLARLEGLAGDYATFQKIVSAADLSFPIHYALGNHDDRELFYKTLGIKRSEEQSKVQRHVSVIDLKEARWIVLDSLLYVNKTAGYLGKQQRQWLSNYLKENSDKPTLLMVHHSLGDEDGELLDSAWLLEAAASFKHVRAIVYGHTHRWQLSQHEHVQLINLPAVGYNFNDAQPVGWVGCEITSKSARFTLHSIGGDRQNHGQVFEVVLG